MSFSEGVDQPDAETLLRRVVEVISNAKSLPLSTSVRIEKDEVLELLQEAIDRLPEELRQARWLLKEREEFLAIATGSGDDILEAARKAGVPAVLLGYSGGEQLIVEGLVSLPLAEIRQAHEGWLPAYMDAVE